MKSKNIIDALGGIDADMIADAERVVAKKSLWLKWAVVAACVCFVILSAMSVPMFLEEIPSETTESGDVDIISGTGWNDVIETSDVVLPPKIPVFNDAEYSAEFIASLLESNRIDAIPVNSYTKIYLPNGTSPTIVPMPEDEYLSIYEYDSSAETLEKEKFEALFDAIMLRLSGALGEKMPTYDITGSESSSDYLTPSVEMGDYRVYASLMNNRSRISFSSFSDDRRVTLYGKTIEVDQRMKDEDIIGSFAGIRDILFKIFGSSFKDAKVIRVYNSYSDYGAVRLVIYFYDEDAHPLNSIEGTPVSDYISVSFDNFENYSGDIVSKDILTTASVTYVKKLGDVENEYKVISSAKRISLENAETLLYNGYVFGVHSCPLCMASQDKIDFEDYSFVGIEYLFGYDTQSNMPTMGIPFYSFYKEIGVSENGNIIYAKTYVPAIEVSGYAEYFESQKSQHIN